MNVLNTQGGASMIRLLVDAPSGAQELVDIGPGGAYFDAARIVWDERIDVPLPAGNTLGGMVRQGGALVFSAERKAQHDAALVVIPAEVTMRQARQALILAELDEAVEAAINAIPGVAGKLARAEWDKSQTVQRNRPLVNQLGAALGLTPQQIDALFITAATL